MKQVEVDQDFIIAIEHSLGKVNARVRKTEREIQEYYGEIEFLREKLEYDQKILVSLEKFLSGVGVKFPRTITITEEELLAALNR